MVKKTTKEKEERLIFACPNCGSTAFVQQGLANFTEEVSLWTALRQALVVEGGGPELDIIESCISCSQCQAKVG
ncbi:hypothetical protein A2291_05985 [candidate division WOR-1 bacterium RIFOXYB2_FULL_42_35]|uniref:Uncharacterized protein n=1 Tax=candidate division WOR-1 bacterium RIFOXYC2_FULL_41_25 TaxID=1802586 RepID=A0A1F4TLF3_UNCSA|nr:MAG: hypothetical protein A2247_01645 [candidate division WOR-1 bacterium RIFOXYA2_FULL_41_14]OGC22274.1 MAG: hypothetical protein A2291_05985 [candidate division WOR-1 bacterium RIFOXYB2_FULL_42_35]OGC32893.1 MAG: hypothetical protein A2462_00660 [candidate division WOR-1 bacterium RIFOXYC2_FULL_41_25]